MEDTETYMSKKIKYMILDTIAHILLTTLIGLMILLISDLIWVYSSEERKIEVLQNYHRVVTEDLKLENVPKLEYYYEAIDEETDRLRKGYYSNKYKTININTEVLNSAKTDAVNTLAHETLHYWQYNVANVGEEVYAVEMRENIADYSRRNLGSLKDYTEYRIHPIEKQARAYAKRFEQRYIIDKTYNISVLAIQIYLSFMIPIKTIKFMYKNLRGK